MRNFLVISALGEDRPGIVDQLSKAVLEGGCNIEDSRMTVLGGEFAVLLMISGPWNSIAKVESSLERVAAELDLTVTTRRTGERDARRHLMPYAVDVVALDHPGIVHNLAHFFSSRNINIEEMVTSSYAAAHTGAPMFTVRMVVDIPAEFQIASLRDEFLDFCDELNVDAVFEPVKS
ncbi:MAG: glycine cleavage system protein R [Gammaproteobacteria bacterium]